MPSFALLAVIENRLHRLVVEQIEAELNGGPVRLSEERVRALARDLLEAEPEILRQDEKTELVEAVADRILGLGPLEPYLRDPEITEIMVNGPDEVFIERRGQLSPAPIKFHNKEQLMHTIHRIVGRVGRRIDESNPRVDARLPEYDARVNAIIPPLAIKNPVLTIRKFSPEPFTLKKLAGDDTATLTDSMAYFLRACVLAKVSMIISGGTGSGKTSTLNALTRQIPFSERLVTIEDTAELNLDHPNLVALEAKPPNVEGAGAVTIRDLVRNALRMRPDRIIVGEVRGEEAFDMLQAMNTGHEGSLTTAHANSPQDVLGRLRGMVAQVVDWNIRTIDEQIASALEIIIHQERLAGGKRKIVSVAEVMPSPTGSPLIVELVQFQQHGINASGDAQGEFRYSQKPSPHLIEKLKRVNQWPLDFNLPL